MQTFLNPMANLQTSLSMIIDQNAKLSYEVFSIYHMYHTTVNDDIMMRVYSIHCSKKTREGYI